jgi:SAM-dependent methyltransferase
MACSSAYNHQVASEVAAAPGRIGWEGSALEFRAISESIPHYAEITRRLIGALPPHAKRVIDFGCGYGRTARAILATGDSAGLHLYLVDRSEEMLTLTADIDPGQARLSVLRDDELLSAIPAAETGRIDAITCNSSLHLLRDFEGAIDLRPFLDRARELLRSGGLLLANLPEQAYHFEDGWESLFHRHARDLSPDSEFRAAIERFSGGLLEKLGSEAGFAVRLETHTARVSWNDFISFYRIPALGEARMPHLSQAERITYLDRLAPRFDAVDYRSVLVRMEKKRNE